MRTPRILELGHIYHGSFEQKGPNVSLGPVVTEHLTTGCQVVLRYKLDVIRRHRQQSNMTEVVHSKLDSKSPEGMSKSNRQAAQTPTAPNSIDLTSLF